MSWALRAARAWCCAREKLGCIKPKEFECTEGVLDASHWSEAQQAQFGADVSQVKRHYCCHMEKVGRPSHDVDLQELEFMSGQAVRGLLSPLGWGWLLAACFSPGRRRTSRGLRATSAPVGIGLWTRSSRWDEGRVGAER